MAPHVWKIFSLLDLTAHFLALLQATTYVNSAILAELTQELTLSSQEETQAPSTRTLRPQRRCWRVQRRAAWGGFHTSAGAADNAWSVSLKANSWLLSLLTQDNSNQASSRWATALVIRSQLLALCLKTVAETWWCKKLRQKKLLSYNVNPHWDSNVSWPNN